jgi:hypothetical protein
MRLLEGFILQKAKSKHTQWVSFLDKLHNTAPHHNWTANFYYPYIALQYGRCPIGADKAVGISGPTGPAEVSIYSTFPKPTGRRALCKIRSPLSLIGK